MFYRFSTCVKLECIHIPEWLQWLQYLLNEVTEFYMKGYEGGRNANVKGKNISISISFFKKIHRITRRLVVKSERKYLALHFEAE